MRAFQNSVLKEIKMFLETINYPARAEIVYILQALYLGCGRKQLSCFDGGVEHGMARAKPVYSHN